ncbi:hypothetical protein ACIRU8_43025 [Streptomyces sp. NPDC101175]|uniref:hypothetical protein n=1 Tax=Streptomyces sp. NPDC101175 TaxID=3366123 RepID=UPI003838DDB3
MTGLHVKIIKRDPPPSATGATLLSFQDPVNACMPSGGNRIEAKVSLDGISSLKEITLLKKDESKLPITLPAGSYLNVSLTASASLSTCTWIPVVDWISQGKRHSDEIKTAGIHFKTAPSKGLKAVTLVPSKEKDGWIDATQSP